MIPMAEVPNRLSYAILGGLASVDFTRNAHELECLVDGIRDISISQEPPLIIPTTAAEINRLPPEMLAAIFVHLSKQEPDSHGRKASYFVQDLVSVTHVCRSWRQVAITAPELWTQITMANLEAVKVFLERSGAVPLKVDIRLGSKGEAHEKILQALFPHARRFRQLYVLTNRGPGSIEPIPFTEPAPLLERLVIRHSMGNRPALLFDDQAPRLRELVIISTGFWIQNQLGNLTSLHITLTHNRRTHSDSLLFFDMLRRCPVLEEMFVSWGGWGPELKPQQHPTIPLHHLRKLLLRSFPIERVKHLLHTFDLKTNGIAVHLSGVNPSGEGDGAISDIQAMFQNTNSGQPSLVSSTKLELIFHTRPRTIIMHAVGPGFTTRIDLATEGFIFRDNVDFTFCDVFPLVKELWVRGSSRVETKLYGIEHFTALEKLVLVGRGSKVVRNFRQALSLCPSGIIPCPLLSTIDCHGSSSEMREMFLLLRTRSSAGRQLEKVRVPSRFIPLPADIASCVRHVGSLDIPSRVLHMYSMELPEFCFVEEHEWWEPWRSRLN